MTTRGTLSVDVELHRGAFALRAAFESEAAVTALFGRSGAGKTTLVDSIAGLARPDRGRIAIDGEPLFDSALGIDVPTHRRRVGYVFQEGRLLPHLTVRQNLLYGRLFGGRGGGHAELAHMVELLGLGHLMERRPAALSGGEKQRVAIGRALLAHPRILLMDEPLASLDLQRKSEILQYIELLAEELDVPIVYVTHATDEIVRLADTVVMLADGAVAARGDVGDVLGHSELRAPGVKFEGGTVIEAKVIGHDMEYGLTRLGFSGGELVSASVDALIGEPVRVRVRARDVSVALDAPAGISIQNVLRGTLVAIEADGGPIAELRIDVGGVLLRSRVTRLAVDRLGLAAGRPLYALIKAISLDRHSVGYA